MNKTYKVVFNKARGVLMVANEITSSIQKKGTKTVVATAVATAVALASGTVLAQTDELVSTSNQEVTATGWGALADIYQKEDVVYEDIQYTNNKVTVSGSDINQLYGGVADLYETKATIKNSSFIGNTSIIQELGKTNGVTNDDTNLISGGVFMVKNGSNHIVDSVFKNNIVQSSVDGNVGAFVAGGAIYQDAVINKDDGQKHSAMVIEVTEGKDIAYTGNNVISSTPDVYYGLYGTVSTSAGGFLFLDRDSSTEFRVGKNATLRIGDANSTGNMDSIASSIVIDGKDATLTGFEKTGLGLLEINSSLDKFYGTVTVTEGGLSVTKDWTVMNELEVAEGATLTVGNLTLGNSPKSLTWNGKEYSEGDGQLVTTYGQLTSLGTVTAKNVALNNKENTLKVQAGSFTLDNLIITEGSVSVEGGTMDINGTVTNDKGTFGIRSGVLKANGSVVFKDLGKDTVALNDAVFSENNLTGGSIDIKDFTGEYNLALLEQLKSLTGGASVALRNGQLVDSEATLDKVLDAQANAAGEQVSAEVGTDKKVTVDNGNDAKVSSIVVEGDKVNAAESFDLNAGQFTLAGGEAGTELVSGNLAEDFKVNVADGAELVLGFDADSKGQISHTVSVTNGGEMTVEAGQFNVAHVEANGTVNVANASTLVADKLTGAGTVLVGNEATAGKLSVKSLEGMTGTLFVDPAWKDDAALNVVGNASHLEIAQVGKDGLTAKVVAGQNALVSFGTTADDAAQAFENIASAQGLSWGKDNITAAAFIDGTLALDKGGLVVDGSLTVAPQTVTAGTVTVAKNGMLMLNQANVGDAVVDGAVSLAEGSYLGVVNATEGSFVLATGDLTDVGATVVTDNPFIVGALDADSKKVTTSLDEEAGLGAIASTGIQAMTRRADFMMAETIADRTSVDQDLTAGTNLWVTVTGERYDVDHMGDVGQFEADMGYGAFGAEYALTDTVTAGAAFQYGKGSLRSDVSNIKNDIANYGLTAYAAKSFGAVKVVGEVSYLQSENDITSSQTALNQSVDAKIYSAGVRAQYQIKTDNFQFVPSIGVRVSKLESDAMTVGSVNVEDQDQTLVQVPIALRINGIQQNAAGWNLAPSMKVAFVPTFGDKEISVLGHDQDVIDTTPVQADFGLRATKGNMMLDANFMMGGGEGGSSSVGGKVGLKYVF